MPTNSALSPAIEQLNSRIARLAIALGLSLKNEADVARVMTWQALPALQPDRRTPSERRTSARTGSAMERRTSRTWEELRGLIVLRYDIQKNYVDQVGVMITRQILEDAETSLERQGFKPGEDGIDIARLFRDV